MAARVRGNRGPGAAAVPGATEVHRRHPSQRRLRRDGRQPTAARYGRRHPGAVDRAGTAGDPGPWQPAPSPGRRLPASRWFPARRSASRPVRRAARRSVPGTITAAVAARPRHSLKPRPLATRARRRTPAGWPRRLLRAVARHVIPVDDPGHRRAAPGAVRASPSSRAVGELVEDVGLPGVPHRVAEDMRQCPAQRVVAVGLGPPEPIAVRLITASLSAQARR